MIAPDVPPTTIPPPEREHRSAAAEREAAREEFLGGATLLVADARTAFLLLNEARARVMTRLFGISGPGSTLVTIIALGLAWESTHRKVARVVKAPGTPELGEVAIGTAVLTESIRWLGGPATGESPFLGPLVLFALAGHALRPVVRSTVHGARSSAHRAHTGLDHRYGHIVRRNRPRPV